MPTPTPSPAATVPPFPTELTPLLGKLLAASPSMAQAMAERPLDDIAVHDFAFHEFLFDYSQGFIGSELSMAGQAYLAAAKTSGADAALIAELRVFLIALEGAAHKRAVIWGMSSTRSVALLQMIADLYTNSPLLLFLFLLASYANANESVPDMLLQNLSNFLSYPAQMAMVAAGGAWSVFMNQRFAIATTTYTPDGFYQLVSDPGGLDGLVQINSFVPTSLLGWLNAKLKQASTTVKSAPQDYPFLVAPELATNIGLRLIYRQQWSPLALQRGDLVRTIPLGPGQRERVSTKIIARRKDSQSSESRRETESSTESTQSTKDSSEVIAEAAKSFKWDVSAKLQASYGFVSGEATASAGGASEDKSKDTSSKLSESVSKTASRMRTETKTVVSTETERTYERETSSEITNPNNEVAITYEYYKIQQQYDVFTKLYEVEGVIYVAEHLPIPGEVDADWVRRHDWILSELLLDESFRDTLNQLISDVDQETDPTPNGAGGDPYSQMMDAARQNFAQFGAAAGGTGLSIPDIYATPQQMFQARMREIVERSRANTLRSVRRGRLFEHIRDNILHYCRAIWASEDSEQRWLRYQKEGRTVPDEWRSTLQATAAGVVTNSGWTPSGKVRPLTDVIDPLGPLGFVGNYAVWGLRATGEEPVIHTRGSLTVPKKPSQANNKSTGGTNKSQVAPAMTVTANLLGVLALSKTPYADPVTGDLLDPALTSFRRAAAGRSAAQLAALSDDQVLDLASYFPRLAASLLTANGTVARTNGVLTTPPTTEQWAQYLYRKNGTRRFLVDSDNVTLALRVGDGAALEPFKRAHRYLDVLQAGAALEAELLKNERRRTLASDAAAFDPDIAKVVVVEGDKAVTGGMLGVTP